MAQQHGSEGGSSRYWQRRGREKKYQYKQQSWGASYNGREGRLRRREADVARREAAVAADEERAKALVREFGVTAGLGSEDAVSRVAELTTNYVKDVLRAIWMAGRPDVASAMCASFDDAPSFAISSRDRSRSRSRSERGERWEEAKEEEHPAVEEQQPSTSAAEAPYDDTVPDFGSDSEC